MQAIWGADQSRRNRGQLVLLAPPTVGYKRPRPRASTQFIIYYACYTRRAETQRDTWLEFTVGDERTVLRGERNTRGQFQM